MASSGVSEEVEKWVHDMQLFSELVRTPGWDRLRGYFEQEEFKAMERIISRGEEVEFDRGYIQGLRFAAGYPQYIIDKMKERVNHG